jgi:hypothetical protein
MLPGQSVAEIPEKPEALVLYKRCKSTGLPLVEGGVSDQPHIWLEELSVIVSVEELHQQNLQLSQATE